MGHHHAHSGQGHHGHDHGHGAGNEKAVGIAAFLTGGFMLAEVAGGLLAGSLALLADAGHMLTDFGSLLLAWFAFRLARRPADWKRTYGFDRFSVLAAFVNGITLFAIVAWILVEAVRRLLNPPEVSGGLMIWIAVAGLLVNILAFWVLTREESDNLNIRAAALHVMGDLLGSVAAIIASLVIIVTGWMPIDPLLSLLVALLIVRSAYKVVVESGHILLEGSPRDLDSRQIKSELREAIAGVVNIEHLHVWSITQERRMATMEAEFSAEADPAAVKQQIKALMEERFRVGHVTIEIVGRVSEDA